jgi:hypothetical protein
MLHNVSYVRPCESEVLESAGHATVPGCIDDECTLRCRSLQSNIRGCADRLTVAHVGPFQDLFGVLLLGEEEAISVMMNINAKEELQTMAEDMRKSRYG